MLIADCCVQGLLKGVDQMTNMILCDSHERVFSLSAGVEQVVLGLYIIRGDNMWVVDLVVILCVQTTEYVLVRYLS